MKLFEEAGQDHEEFKLELEKDKTIELAQIDVQRQIAEQQAIVIGEALKHSKIDIVGGEAEFFDRITRAITTGKVVDRTIGNSQVLGDVKDTFFNGDPEYFKAQVGTWIAGLRRRHRGSEKPQCLRSARKARRLRRTARSASGSSACWVPPSASAGDEKPLLK